jgi:hypothetical protein
MKEPPIPDMFDKVEGESSFLGDLASKIPGFDGYMERSRRREADQLLRSTIASRLEETRLQLSSVQQELSRDIVRAMDYAEALGRADTKLMGFIGKINNAPEGYAGFFDAVKVNEDDLARVYAFDESMLAYADQIDADVNALEKAVLEDDDIDERIRALDNTLREANSAFNSRQEVLSGIA